MIEDTMKAWHRLVATKDETGLDDILASDVVFHSPVVHTPQEGKQITRLYLSAAMQVLNNDSFKYVREVVSDYDAVLEFMTHTSDSFSPVLFSGGRGLGVRGLSSARTRRRAST